MSSTRAPRSSDPTSFDPGIRQLVIDIWADGFRTSDSGDGVSKFQDGYCDVGNRWQICPFPHVQFEAVETPLEVFELEEKLRVWLARRPELSEWSIAWIDVGEQTLRWVAMLCGPIVPESQAIVRAEWPVDAVPYDI